MQDTNDWFWFFTSVREEYAHWLSTRGENGSQPFVGYVCGALLGLILSSIFINFGFESVHPLIQLAVAYLAGRFCVRHMEFFSEDLRWSVWKRHMLEGFCWAYVFCGTIVFIWRIVSVQ